MKRIPCKPSGLCSLFSAVVPLETWIHRISKTFIISISATHCSHVVFCMPTSVASMCSFATPVVVMFLFHKLFLIFRIPCSYFESQKSYSSDYTLSHHSATAPGNYQTQGMCQFTLAFRICPFFLWLSDREVTDNYYYTCGVGVHCF